MSSKHIEEFNHHRFDNYTAWLDLQQRAAQKSKKHFFGEVPKEVLYGFDEGEPVDYKPREKSPFKVREPAFTSGLKVSRKYDKNATLSDMPIDFQRTDPFHFPNTVGSTAKCHWEDYRSGNRNPEFIKECLKRPLDKELYAQVSDEQVKDLYKKQTTGKAKPVDKDCAKILFAPDIEVLGGKRTERLRLEEEARENAEKIEYAKALAAEQKAKVERFADEKKAVSLPPRGRERNPPGPKVLVTSILDGNSDHYRMQGGKHAQRGFAGSWSVNHGGGAGISQFSVAPPPLLSFW